MKRWIAPLIAGLFLLGCNQNPFPSAGPLSPDKPQPVIHQDPPKPIPAYVLTVPDVMVFHAQEEREFTISASVPAPGKAIVAANGLPRGAHFYPNTLKLVWTPNITDPSQTAEPFVVEFSLQSTEDPILTYKHNAVLVVEGNAPTPQVVKLGDEIHVPFAASNVRIEPELSSVQWKDQELVVKPSGPGLVTFTAVVKDIEGFENAQPFSFWVIP